MEAKVKEWKAAKAKSESNNPSQENPPWYRTPLGIFGIVMAIIIVVGMIFYFVKQKTSEENTN